jgi:hypothetical protein
VRQTGTDELAGDGKNQAGLNGRIEGIEKIGKGETLVGDGRNRGLHSVASKINPFQKVRDLVSADTECDFQYFRSSNLLRHAGVEAGTTLLNVAEVEGGDIGNDLNMSGGAVEVASVVGMAVRLVMVMAWGNVAPKSGFFWLR